MGMYAPGSTVLYIKCFPLIKDPVTCGEQGRYLKDISLQVMILIAVAIAIRPKNLHVISCYH